MCVHLRLWQNRRIPWKNWAFARAVPSAERRSVVIIIIIRVWTPAAAYVMFSRRRVRLREARRGIVAFGPQPAGQTGWRRTPFPTTDRPRRRRLLRYIIRVIVYRILRAPHTRVEPDWHHVSTRRLAMVTTTRPAHTRPRGTSFPPARPLPTPARRLGVSAVWLSFVLSGVRVRACAGGGDDVQHTHTYGTVRAAGRRPNSASLSALSGPPPRTALSRYPTPQHRRRACRSVGRSVGRRRKPERSHIFRYSAVLYYLYYYIYLYNNMYLCSAGQPVVKRTSKLLVCPR